MRRSFCVAACLLLAALPGAYSAFGADPLPAPPAPVPAEQSPVKAGLPDNSGAEAAQLHAKRTACRRDAKLKKLVGATKTAFMKSCIAAK
jgi:hypothetical protein